jgi:hypothetical protein
MWCRSLILRETNNIQVADSPGASSSEKASPSRIYNLQSNSEVKFRNVLKAVDSNGHGIGEEGSKYWKGTGHAHLKQDVRRNQLLRHGTNNRLVVGTVHVTLGILRSDSLGCLLSSVFA